MLLEAVIGGLGALVILLFVFGTLPAVLMPIVVAVAAILNTFTLIWVLTYITNVSIIVQFLIALVGLGVAIDYALLMIFRFRDELREGEDVETALVETMTHAGRSVIVSGSTVAVGLLSMIILPLPFIRSMGIGGMLIPAVSVIAAITLLPALLAVLGDADQQRARDAEAVRRQRPSRGRRLGPLGALRAAPPVCPSRPSGSRSSRCSPRSATQLNPNESQLKNFPGTGTAIAGPPDARRRRHQPRRDEAVRRPRRERRQRAGDRREGAARSPGVAGAAVPAGWQRGSDSLVEAFPAIDGAAPGIQGIVDRVNARAEGHRTARSAASRRSTATSCTRSTATSRTCSRS